jgi:hypothetical protein
MTKQTTEIKSEPKEINNNYLWKTILVLSFIILITILLILIIKPYPVEVEKMRIIKVGGFFTSLYVAIDKVDIINSDCINAQVYYPITQPNKIWIDKVGFGPDARCYIRYKEVVTKYRI